MAGDWTTALVQGGVQALGTALGGAIAAVAGFEVAGRNARAASEAKAEERKAQRDDHQRQVLTDLLDALGDYNEMFGRQLRDTEDHGVISDETTTKAFSAGGRVDRLVAQIRNQELRTQLADYRRLLLRLVIAYDPGHLLEAVQQVHDPNRELLDAIHAELNQYL